MKKEKEVKSLKGLLVEHFQKKYNEQHGKKLFKWLDWLHKDPFTALAAHASVDIDFFEAYDLWTRQWISNDFAEKIGYHSAGFGDSKVFEMYEDEFILITIDIVENTITLNRKNVTYFKLVSANIRDDWDGDTITGEVENIIKGDFFRFIHEAVKGNKANQKLEKEKSRQTKMKFS